MRHDLRVNKMGESIYPVAMYDIEDKKIVALFRGCGYASKYVFGGPSRVCSKTILAKKVYETNIYERPITFRSAPQEYIPLLTEEHTILDPRFEIKDVERKIKKKKDPLVLDTKVHVKRYEERDKIIYQMAAEGYTAVEIGRAIKEKTNVIISVLYKKNNVYADEKWRELSVNQLKKKMALMKIRIKRMENKNVQNDSKEETAG